MGCVYIFAHHYTLALATRSVLDCYSSPRGEDYIGRLAITGSGRVCKTWIHVDNDSLAQLGYDVDQERAQLVELGNYCRNPSAVRSRPWCYVYDPYSHVEQWELCEAEICKRPGMKTPSYHQYCLWYLALYIPLSCEQSTGLYFYCTGYYGYYGQGNWSCLQDT